MNGKIKILFVTTNLAGGGAEKVLVTILEHLDKNLFEPKLVLFQDIYAYPVPNDIPLICLNKKGWYDFPRLVLDLSKIYSKNKPDVVLSFLRYTNLVAVLAKIFSRIQFTLILSQHDIPSTFFGHTKNPVLYIFGKLMPRWLYNKANGIICVAQGVADDVRKFYGVSASKLKVINNPIDIKTISKLCIENVDHPWFLGNDPVIISVGRLDAIKGYPHLLRAFAKVVPQLPCHLVILGEGTERDTLKVLAKNLGIEDRVAFLGFQTNPFKYMAHSDLLVFSSLAGEFGNVVKEAMCCGIPVVANHYYNEPKTTITHGIDGLLVLQGDENALATAITTILTDRILASKLAQKGKLRSEDFSIEKVIKEYQKYILDKVS